MDLARVFGPLGGGRAGAERRPRGQPKRRERGQPARRRGVKFDRMTALGVGVLLGLTAVAVDPRKPVAPDQAPADALGRAKYIGGGWLGVAQRTWAEFSEDRIPTVAAGSTFYALLALFPALGLFVSLYGRSRPSRACCRRAGSRC